MYPCIRIIQVFLWGGYGERGGDVRGDETDEYTFL